MKHRFLWVSALCLAFCPVSEGRVLEFLRGHLISFAVGGYDPLKDVRSFLDIGHAEVEELGRPTCKIVDPRGETSAAKESWAPFHFYSNILTVAEKEKHAEEKTIGEPDVFYVGDDLNRNGGNDSHEWTRVVEKNFRGSLQFSELFPTQPADRKDFLTYRVRFIRGTIGFDGMIKVQSRRENRGCEAAVYYCEKSVVGADKKRACPAGGWDKRLLKVVAEASQSGAAYDIAFRIADETKKHDVSKIFMKFQDLDPMGNPVGSPYFAKVGDVNVNGGKALFEKVDMTDSNNQKFFHPF